MPRSNSKNVRALRLAALRRKAERMPIDQLVKMSGVSRATVTRFRSGCGVAADTEALLFGALKAKRGDAVYTPPTTLAGLPLDSGKPWKGETSWVEVFGGRHCGWCGGRCNGPCRP